MGGCVGGWWVGGWVGAWMGGSTHDTLSQLYCWVCLGLVELCWVIMRHIWVRLGLSGLLSSRDCV